MKTFSNVWLHCVELFHGLSMWPLFFISPPTHQFADTLLPSFGMVGGGGLVWNQRSLQRTISFPWAQQAMGVVTNKIRAWPKTDINTLSACSRGTWGGLLAKVPLPSVRSTWVKTPLPEPPPPHSSQSHAYYIVTLTVIWLCKVWLKI